MWLCFYILPMLVYFHFMVAPRNLKRNCATWIQTPVHHLSSSGKLSMKLSLLHYTEPSLHDQWLSTLISMIPIYLTIPLWRVTWIVYENINWHTCTPHINSECTTKNSVLSSLQRSSAQWKTRLSGFSMLVQFWTRKEFGWESPSEAAPFFPVRLGSVLLLKKKKKSSFF